MTKSLVVVESPAKARTIARYLGKGFEVEATMGHIRDLPSKDLGIDIEGGFKPSYVVISSRKKIVTQLRKKAAEADRVYLAPDLDREGEAIAWHVKDALKIDDEKAFRVTFNEITKGAIKKAFENPGKISSDKVNAQQARRLLDRLVGYKISPLLWKRIPNVSPKGPSGKRRGLSAGRVQSVAVRLIVDREREIEAFEAREFWRITARLTKAGQEFEAELDLENGQKIEVSDDKGAKAVLQALDGASFVVASLEAKETKSNPSPPFTTSTLQQSASTILRFAAGRTMRVAQQLYEGVEMGEDGPVALITYMRTDSVRISGEAVAAARDHVAENFGPDYLPAKPRSYRSKASAQEAHEAVRPTYMGRTPDSARGYLTDEQYKLYRLIWRRAVASQMAPARFNITNVEIGAGPYTFAAKGRVVVFDGHTVLANATPGEETILPKLAEGDELDLLAIDTQQKFTQPPPRYTEAALVRTLEKEGIGRPSTYAAIISTIQEHHYVQQEKRTFRPTSLGVFVTDKLVKHFPKILDVKFTGHMEEELDRIESGRMDWVAVLDEFYNAFKGDLAAAEDEMTSFVDTDEKCPECKAGLVRRLSRMGLYLACSSYPDCKYTRNLSITGRDISAALAEKKCPVCGKELSLRGGIRGPFVGCSGYPECKYTSTVEDPEGGSAAPADGDDTDGDETPKRDCPQCDKALVVREGKRGKFWGCTGFPKCRHTEALEGAEGEGQVQVEGEIPDKKCPNCGKALVLKTGRRGPFLACPGYPACKHAESIKGVKVKKEPPKKVDRKCPECGKDLVYRKGGRGTFVGCSAYPRCKHTEAVTETS